MRIVTYVEVKRNCQVCNKEFEIRQKDQTCCSKSCRQKRDYPKYQSKRLEQSTQWYKDNKEKVSTQRKKRYADNPEKYRKESKSWRLANPERVRENNKKYKDKVRHGKKREELIKKNGLVCSICGDTGDRFKIIAHHKTFDPTDHSDQELLCRACHCRLHHSIEKKPRTREEIKEALRTSKNLFEACHKLGLNRSSLYQKRKRYGLI